ncbi:GH1 family beta-glucosidase [Pseudaestuariivita sp.]|uniref:GH1 family beta-glucosidase n=1 Tax=Pseudaestuariivita sp. TaxID=2211669 RepID=UPI004058F988
MLTHSRSDFPDGFLFGTATSAYQIEGHAFGGAGQTHWDSFAATPGNVVRGEDGARACDHYHRYEEDLDLIAAAGFDAYRFSTSWARVMPDGETVNPEGLDFYDRLTDAMLARGLKPMATLYHWELPQTLADIGGWRNRETPARFADFASVIMGRIGDRMHSVAPINEPWCVGYLSHFLGEHAPGMRDIRATARAMHHVLVAHGMATEVMRGLGMQNLGAVFNFEWATPSDNTPEAVEAAARYDAIYNRFFLDGVFKGTYPRRVLEAFEPHLPTGWQDDFALIGQRLDWCGLNYYTRKVIAPDPGPWPALKEVEGPLPKTQMGWEIYPQGLHDFLVRTAEDYTGDLPLYVTENGCASAEPFEDTDRIAYLDAHLSAVREAIAKGVPLSGYVVWSLMDNYEWAKGYEMRFGLVHVDFETLQRTPKASYRALKAALA